MIQRYLSVSHQKPKKNHCYLGPAYLSLSLSLFSFSRSLSISLSLSRSLSLSLSLSLLSFSLSLSLSLLMLTGPSQVETPKLVAPTTTYLLF